jgi:hypothetical protein
MKRTNALIRLHESGHWQKLYPHLKYAYQIKNGNGFMGVFPVDVIRKYPNLENSNGTIYLGLPNALFQPLPGRDQVRDENGKLTTLLEEKNVNVFKEIKQCVQDTPMELTVYQLDRSLQAEIIESSSFEGYYVQIIGLNPIGLEIAVLLAKMGVEHLALYDPTKVLRTDVSASRYRVTDPENSRITKAAEIIGDGTSCEIETYAKYPDGLEKLGNIVINASYDIDVRKNLWKFVKNSDGVSLYVDAQIRNDNGRTFHFSPKDKIGVEAYEMELATSSDILPNEIASMTSYIGGSIANFIVKYARTTMQIRQHQLERTQLLDMFNNFSALENF